MTEKLLNIKLQKNTFKEYLDALALKYKITKVVANFSGSADSGEVDCIVGKAQDLEGDDVELSTEESEELDTFFSEYLSSTNYDWYNNDGGYGEIILDLVTYIVKCEMNINVTSSEEHLLEDQNITSTYEI